MFKAFADFWGFEPRLCRAYRAQTKGKVESGVKYFKRKFLAGRRFRDDLDLHEQLQEWTATVADVRVHGTTHERPVDRFARERDALVPAPAGRAFRLEAPLTRVVATDYLVSVDTNRYSVPFTLIGQPVEVRRRDGQTGEAAPRPSGHHASGARGPAPVPDPAGARAGSDCAQRTAALLDRQGFDRRGSARRRGPGRGLLRGGLRPRRCGMISPQLARLDEHLQERHPETTLGTVQVARPGGSRVPRRRDRGLSDPLWAAYGTGRPSPGNTSPGPNTSSMSTAAATLK